MIAIFIGASFPHCDRIILQYQKQIICKNRGCTFVARSRVK